VAIISLTLFMAACGSSGPIGGVATYDALRQARDVCAAKGGTFRLKAQGDSQYVEDFTCERK
jgi:hypothetical protein